MPRLRTLAAAVAAVGIAFAVVAGTAGRASRRRSVARAAVPRPSGSASPAGEAGDAADALVEDARRYPVHAWRFALDRHEMRIVDMGMTTSLDAVLARTGGELAVNGGFFDAKGKPLGLAISGGEKLAPLARSLSGGVLVVDETRARLLETESFALPDDTRSTDVRFADMRFADMRFAIQCRPRLVVGGAPNVKSDDGKRSERTALCLRDGGATLEVVVVRGPDDEATGPSLFALGRWLAARGCEEALNLDGGPSTGVAWREGDAVRSLPPRGPLRHAIVLKRR